MNHLLTIMEVEKVYVSHLLKRICGEGVAYSVPRTEGEKVDAIYLQGNM